MHLEYLDDDGAHRLEVTSDGDELRVDLDGGESWRCVPGDGSTVDVFADGRRRRAWIGRRDGERLVFLDGKVHSFRLPQQDDEEVSEESRGGPRVTAEMPGTIVKIHVAVDQDVTAGDRLLIMEAMKMETEITAPLSGRVQEIAVAEGVTVAQNTLLVVLAPAEQDTDS